MGGEKKRKVALGTQTTSPFKPGAAGASLWLCDAGGNPLKGGARAPTARPELAAGASQAEQDERQRRNDLVDESDPLKQPVPFDKDGKLPLRSLQDRGGRPLEIYLDGGQGSLGFWAVHDSMGPGELKDYSGSPRYGHVKDGDSFVIPTVDGIRKDLTLVVDFQPGIWLCDIEDEPKRIRDISSVNRLGKPLQGELRCWPTLDAAGERDVSSDQTPSKVIAFDKLGRAPVAMVPPGTARIDVYLDESGCSRYRKVKGQSSDQVVDKGHYHLTDASGALLVAGQFEDYSTGSKTRLTLRQVPQQSCKVSVSAWDDARNDSLGAQPVWGAGFSKVKHFFVLMLENRSFDSMLGYSGIPEVDGHRPDKPFTNRFGNQVATAKDTMPGRMLVDPGHEFLHISAQLWETPKHSEDESWKGKVNSADVPSMGGFAQAYFHRLTNPYRDLDGAPYASEEKRKFEITEKMNTAGQTPSKYAHTVMLGYNPDTLPVLNQLAKEFAVCDRWFCSEPSWTTPNRFFMYAASAGNLDDTPSTAGTVSAEAFQGFHFENGTIFQLLDASNRTWRLYENSPFNQARLVDGIPQLAPFNPYDFFKPDLKGLYDWLVPGSGLDTKRLVNNLTNWGSVRSLETLRKDLEDKGKWDGNGSYNFIEPNYGNPLNTSGVVSDFSDGESQHPVGAVHRGEALIRKVYQWLRQSPIWEESALIITYDEHGGFFDHVPPPRAVPPGDSPMPGAKNKVQFKYGRYGVRVPAVVISPLIPKGVVDHTVYDHTSVLKTVEKRLSVPPLTQRDKNANDLAHLFTLEAPRNCLPLPKEPNVPDTAHFFELSERLGMELAIHQATYGGWLIRNLTAQEKKQIGDAAAVASRDAPTQEIKSAIVNKNGAVKTLKDGYLFLKSIEIFLLVDECKEAET
jgi:phospholipase C